MHAHIQPTDNQMTKEQVQVIIESAGRTMMMLPSRGAFPAGYRSCLPEHAREFSDLIEAPKELRPAMLRPTKRQMNELDVVEDWLVDLSTYCRRKNMVYVATTVALCMLHHPRSGRRVFPYRKAAVQLNCDHKTVRAWYLNGVEIITNRVNVELFAGK